MSVRPFVEADIPQVAALYWNYMRGEKGSPPPTVLAYFKELYFTENPCIDSSLPSGVFEDKTGKIVGFLGAVTRKMSVRGQPIRVGYGGNFIVHPEHRSQLAALRLLGDLVAGKQDISLTDSANDTGRHLLERIGFRTIVPFSIHWVRPLRPAHYAVFNIFRLTGHPVPSSLKFVTKPFCALADNFAANLSFNPFRRTAPRMHGADLDVETLLQCLTEFRAGYAIWPEYDLVSLKWLLSFMDRMPARGELRKIIVRDENQKNLGWYIYYAKPDGVGEVVQIGGDTKFTKHILDHLFQDAWDHGVIALHGVANTRLMPDLSSKNCFFTCRGGWAVAHSRKPELLELLNRGDAFLSRLDGEWCLDPGARLDQ